MGNAKPASEPENLSSLIGRSFPVKLGNTHAEKLLQLKRSWQCPLPLPRCYFFRPWKTWNGKYNLFLGENAENKEIINQPKFVDSI